MEPMLLSSSEVCSALFLNRSTLSRWVAAGKIVPAHQAPGRNGAMVFTADEVSRVSESLR